MSRKNSIDIRQDRREWLKTSAGAIGASLLPMPAFSAETPAAPGRGQAAEHAAEAASNGRFFTPAQHTLVEELSETIVPADSHSGGAKAAKVADYIDHVLRSTLDDSEKSVWREGLRLIDIMSEHYNGKSFVAASPEERTAILTVLSENQHMTDIPEVRFFNSLKDLTVEGYYTSKIGILEELEYKGNRFLEEYAGCNDQPPDIKRS